jgi:hypothetical protein
MNKSNQIQLACHELTTILQLKNEKYGNSFDRTVNEFGPLVMLIRLEDKLNRAKQLILNKQKGTSDESLEDTFLDLAGYAILSKLWVEGTNGQTDEESNPNKDF